MTNTTFKPLRRPHAGRKLYNAEDPPTSKRNRVGERGIREAEQRIIRALDGSFSNRDSLAYLAKLHAMLQIWSGAVDEMIERKWNEQAG